MKDLPFPRSGSVTPVSLSKFVDIFTEKGMDTATLKVDIFRSPDIYYQFNDEPRQYYRIDEHAEKGQRWETLAAEHISAQFTGESLGQWCDCPICLIIKKLVAK